MRHHARRCTRLVVAGAALLLALLVDVSLQAQAPRVTPVSTAGRPWTPPRMPDGRPDLEGIWENNSATPLERPRELANQPLLTDEEVARLEKRAAEVFHAEADAVFGDGLYLALLDDTRPRRLGATGTYSQNWLPDRYFERRTSLIEDPADGRLPPIAAQAVQARAAAAAARPRRPEAARDLSLPDRCITFGIPDLFAAYMSLYRIVQTEDYIAIEMEKIHDVRVIPLDGRPHISPSIRHYLGDSRGRWDGDTLVVETTNFHPKGNPMGGLFRQSDEQLRLTERFTRVSDDTIRYAFTVDDPTVWTRPWTAAISWKKASGEIYEYACHEGNYSLPGMLAGARADEAAGR
jgi:hypothetical protein